MSVNQKIKDSLKRGDKAKISKILGIDPSSVTERINSDKEIDSVSFINAVCEVTKKPFSFFKKLNSTYAISEEEMVNMVSDSDEQYMNTKAAENAWVKWRKKACKYEIQKDIALRIPNMTMDEVIEYTKKREAKVNMFDGDEISRMIVEVYSDYYKVNEENNKKQ